MTLELHCWGTESGFHKFHLESVASIWYLLLSGLEFQIIPSSNNIIANLPFLKDEGKIVSGFEAIIVHLKDRFLLDDQLSDEDKLLGYGLRALISDKLNSITLYCLFLNKENYENFSRGLFKYLLPFPMQYAAPLEFKTEATRMCSQIGLNPDNGLVLTEDDNRYREILQTEKKLKVTPTLGSLHSLQKELQLNKLLLEKSTVNNMRAINLFETYISQIMDLKIELNTTEKPYIFGEKISTADLLLFAHITAQTLPELPNQFLKIAIEVKYPTLLNNLQHFTDLIEGLLEIVKVLVPSNEDYPSLNNYLRYRFKTLL